MKGSPVSPFIFSAILALLSPPALNRAGAATPAEIQPRAPAPGRPLNTPAPAGFIVQSVPVNHRAAAEMKNLLAALVTPGGSVAEEPGGKTLTITDAPANIQNVLEIKELTDAPAFAAARLEIFTAKKASADELAGAMAELTQSYLFSVRRDEAAPVELIPFPQGNRILAVGRSENAWNLVRPWLERLDAASGSRRRIFIYPIAPEVGAELDNKLHAGKTGAPPAVLDPVSSALVIYGTAEEFQELRKILSDGRPMEEFKRKLRALRQKMESISKNPAPPS